MIYLESRKIKTPSGFFMQKWKPVKGFEDSYEVSNDGFVMSLPRSVKYKHGGKDRFWPGKILSHYVARNGYCDITLKRANKNHHFGLHRLVGIAFLDNPHNLPQINHKDNNKHNNHVSNLEWCTQSGNVQHAFRNNFHSGRGGTHYLAKQVLHEKTEIVYPTLKKAAEAIGVSSKVLCDMLNGNTSNRSGMRYL
jgi:hypothetical protein